MGFQEKGQDQMHKLGSYECTDDVSNLESRWECLGYNSTNTAKY